MRSFLLDVPLLRLFELGTQFYVWQNGVSLMGHCHLSSALLLHVHQQWRLRYSASG